MTSKWYLDRSMMGQVLILREEDDVPIAQMIFSTEADGGGQLTEKQAVNIAEQIIDDWNFSCDGQDITQPAKDNEVIERKP